MYTGCSLNPARAFAVSVVAHSFPAYHWLYWLGPFLGSVLAMGLHAWITQLEIETSDAKHRVAAEDAVGVEQSHGAAAEAERAGHHLDVVPEHDLEKAEPKQVSK